MGVDVMSIGELLAWIIAGGGAGGVLGLFTRIEFSDKSLLLGQANFSGWKTVILIAISFLIGVGGAVAINWVIIGIGKFSSVATAENRLYILALSVLSGFGGRRILPALTEKFEKELGQTQEELEKTKEEVNLNRLESQNTKQEVRFFNLISKSFEALRETTVPSLRHETIHELEQYLQANPLSRKPAILLGRLQRVEHDLAGAIKGLDNFIEAKKSNNQIDVDYADALYNRAAYKLEHWRSTKVEDILQQVYNDLGESIDVSPTNKTDAESDTDFEQIWEEDRFKSLGITSHSD